MREAKHIEGGEMPGAGGSISSDIEKWQLFQECDGVEHKMSVIVSCNPCEEHYVRCHSGKVTPRSTTNSLSPHHVTTASGMPSPVTSPKERASYSCEPPKLVVGNV